MLVNMTFCKYPLKFCTYVQNAHWTWKFIYIFLILKSGCIFFEEVKLAHLNWHWRESNLRPREGTHSQVPSQYHQDNPSEFKSDYIITELWCILVKFLTVYSVFFYLSFNHMLHLKSISLFHPFCMNLIIDTTF